MKDLAIVGGGPAGVSAALCAKNIDMDFSWFSAGDSEKVALSKKIRNYPGLKNVSGEEMLQSFKAQCDEMGVSPVEAKISAIYKTGKTFSLFAGEESLEFRSVILCVGAGNSKQLPGERELMGKGVSTCAMCDGFLYRGKTIAVISESPRFDDEAQYLASIAKYTYMICSYPTRVSGENVELILDNPTGFSGGERLEKVLIGSREIEADGAFVLRSYTAPGDLVKGLKVEDGHICAGKDCETSIPGVFAAGDCTGRPYQVAKAVGEGNVALHSAAKFLGKL